ncbi:MAG: lipid A biosynthesis acyltransferase [Bergeyella sp.]|nr:lipid A biosynthesis acyltransferase [Bergeyella sp.]
MKIILKIISYVPLRVLYIFSDIMFFVGFYVVKYRKKIVFENLKNSFPKKSEKELKNIQKKFFKNLSDYTVETIKLISITEKELRLRVQHIHHGIFKELEKEKKNIILLTGHVFNWEWLLSITSVCAKENYYSVYRKVNNSFWNNEILNIRNRFKNKSLEAGEVIKHMIKNPNDGDSVYLFVADQTPHVSNVNIGLHFLNQRTPVFVGYDKISSKLDLAFIYCETKKIKRGHYQVNYYRICPENKEFAPYELVKKYHILLENTIRKQPENYLWSHRKWKYSGSIKNMI